MLEEYWKTRDMICVFMGNQDTGKVIRCQLSGTQTLPYFSAGDAGIHQQSSVAAAEEGAVPTGTAGKCAQLQGSLPPYVSIKKQERQLDAAALKNVAVALVRLHPD